MHDRIGKPGKLSLHGADLRLLLTAKEIGEGEMEPWQDVIKVEDITMPKLDRRLSSTIYADRFAARPDNDDDSYTGLQVGEVFVVNICRRI